MREIAYDIPKFWPLTQPEDIASGTFQNVGTGLCPSGHGVGSGNPVQLDSGCTTDWVFSWHEDIRMKVKKICFDDAMGPDRFLSFWDCHQGYGNQLYKYLKESQVSCTF